jgi:tetratricopeptide (TPR) repeat protein
MFTKNNATSFLILIFLIISQKTAAQNIEAKRIFISVGSDVTLRFASEIHDRTFNPFGVSNSLVFSTTKNGITLRPNQKNSDTITLIIEEGKNKKNINRHSFILIYKDKLSRSELDYDFTTKEKIKDAIDNAKQEHENEKKETQSQSSQTNHISSLAGNGSPSSQSGAQALTAEEKDRLFSKVKDKANRAYSEKKYDEALDFYEQALQWKPDDPFCSMQIESIRQMKQVATETTQRTREIEIRNLSYRSHIRKADSAFGIKEWDIARLEYNQALKDSSKDTYAAYKLNQIDKILEEGSYKTAMDIGKGYLTTQDFDKATLAFKEALKIRPGDAEATKQLNSIKSLKDAANRQQAELERNKATEKQYKDTIDYADNAFEVGLWKTARQKYNSALKLRKDDLYAKNQIAKIDSIENLQQQEYSQRRRDSITNEKYQDARRKGDEALAAKDYNSALKAYELAHVLKPSEPYPGAQISQIKIIQNQITMQAQEEKDGKRREDSVTNLFKSYVNKSDAARSKKDYDLANTHIIQALSLKPDDTDALKKSKEINDVLSVIEKDRKYDMFINIGDSLIYQAKNPDASLKWYDSAIVLKPQESRAKKQSIFANYVILQRDSIKMAKENIEALNKNFNEAMPYYRKGDSARIEKRYGEAYEYYTLFLNKTDAFSKTGYSTVQTKYITEAQDYIKRLASFKLKQTDIGLVTAQYPNINFKKPPPDQLFSAQRLDSSKQAAYIKTEILPIPPRINIINSVSDKIRITCQSMNFKEKYIYLRFLVTNNDTSVFLTGPMLLSVAKKSGQISQVLPLFISDFPVVLPTGEKQFVYVIPLMLLWKDETIVFEVSDRLNSRKLSLHINDVIFNMERSRPL